MCCLENGTKTMLICFLKLLNGLHNVHKLLQYIWIWINWHLDKIQMQDLNQTYLMFVMKHTLLIEGKTLEIKLVQWIAHSLWEHKVCGLIPEESMYGFLLCQPSHTGGSWCCLLESQWHTDQAAQNSRPYIASLSPQPVHSLHVPHGHRKEVASYVKDDKRFGPLLFLYL